MSNRHTFTVDVGRKMKAELRRAAKSERITRAEVVRAALRGYLDSRAAKEKREADAKAAHVEMATKMMETPPPEPAAEPPATAAV